MYYSVKRLEGVVQYDVIDESGAPVRFDTIEEAQALADAKKLENSEQVFVVTENKDYGEL